MPPAYTIGAFTTIEARTVAALPLEADRPTGRRTTAMTTMTITTMPTAETMSRTRSPTMVEAAAAEAAVVMATMFPMRNLIMTTDPMPMVDRTRMADPTQMVARTPMTITPTLDDPTVDQQPNRSCRTDRRRTAEPTTTITGQA